MPPPIKKASVVKHQTRSGFHPHAPGRTGGDHGGSGTSSRSTGTGTSTEDAQKRYKGKGKAGFKVGPSHAPDGAYLGKGGLNGRCSCGIYMVKPSSPLPLIAYRLFLLLTADC